MICGPSQVHLPSAGAVSGRSYQGPKERKLILRAFGLHAIRHGSEIRIATLRLPCHGHLRNPLHILQQVHYLARSCGPIRSISRLPTGCRQQKRSGAVGDQICCLREATQGRHLTLSAQSFLYLSISSEEVQRLARSLALALRRPPPPIVPLPICGDSALPLTPVPREANFRSPSLIPQTGRNFPGDFGRGFSTAGALTRQYGSAAC